MLCLSADKVGEGRVLVRGGKSLPFGERFFLLHLCRGVGGIRRSEIKILINEENFSIFLPDFYWE